MATSVDKLMSEQGLIVAALTPFNARNTTVDVARFDHQLRILKALKPLAVAVGAVETQEFQVLTRACRMELVARSREMLGPDIAVIAGVSHPSLTESIDLAKESEQHGADAVLALAAPKPWGAPPLAAESVRWFTTLADCSPRPVFVYNNPRLTVDLDPDTLRTLGEHPNVAGMKETSRDEGKLLALIKHVQPHMRVFTNMEMLLSTISLGGAGAMLPTPGVPIASRIVDDLLAGRVQDAAELTRFFAEFPNRWMSRGLLPAMKAASRLMGCDVGEPLWPYESLSVSESEALREYLESWGMRDALAAELV